MKILVSACLLGENCKYSGGNNKNDNVIALGKEHTLIPICPEKFAGLPAPRLPAEIRGGKVFSKGGDDWTEYFKEGARQSLYIAEEAGCRIAVLKERSPSCGFKKIYDGTFSGRLINGNGVTAQLLYDNGITVLGETQIAKIKEFCE